MHIAGAGHELGLTQLQGQALRIHLAGVVEHLPRLAVAALLEVVLDERFQLHEVEKVEALDATMDSYRSTIPAISRAS